MKSSYWQNIEFDLFVLMVLVNLQPILTPTVFPTMDGASHLANANIINQLVLYKNQFFEQFFILNPEPVPNWTTHLLLSALLLIFPAWIAEKILLAALFISTPLVFRLLVRTVAPEKTFYSFLVFPFTHSMFLFFGFFNFCISVVFLLLTVLFWIKNHGRILKLKLILLLTILVLLTYFSHLMTFGVLLIVIALHIITQLIPGMKKKEERNSAIRMFLVRTGAITVASIIPLLLFLQFFLQRPGVSDMKFLPFSTLVNDLVTLRPLIVFNPYFETPVLVLFFMIIMVLFAAALFFTIKARREFKTDWWLPSVIAVMLLLYFLLPSSMGTASYVNIRISFIMFLILIVMLATLPANKFIALFVISAGLIINMATYRNIKPKIRELEILAAQCYNASPYLEPGAVVMPVDLMNNWFTGHFVDYIAADKPVVMVYNYECETNYFPVIWNKEQRPNYYIGEPFSADRGIEFKYNQRNVTAVSVDYVMILTPDGNKGRSAYFGPEFLQKLQGILDNQFSLIFDEGHCKLYKKLKKQTIVKMISPDHEYFGKLQSKGYQQMKL